MANDCPCNPPAVPFFCEILQRKMSPWMSHLCRTKPAYRLKWERQKPQPKHSALPVEGGCLSGYDRGIVTGGTSIHWPCMGALAIAAARYGIGFAVADHGLSQFQREELTRCGTHWIDHQRPSVDQARNGRTIAALKAWWKPWVCLASPFSRSVWIDSDAVLLADPKPLFDSAPALSTQGAFGTTKFRLYHPLLESLFGAEGLRGFPVVEEINTGVLSWARGEPLISEWAEWSTRLLEDPVRLALCGVRDQSSMMALLIHRQVTGQPLPTLLEDRWNWPADGLTHHMMHARLPVPLVPETLLATVAERHPDIGVVHWLSRVKPWGIQEPEQPPEAETKAPPPPLRQWLVEQLGRLRESEAKRRYYRTPTAALEILDGCCSTCDQYDQRRESCRAVHGCGSVNRYRHALTTVSGRCPLAVW